jgi:hypothetical protein
MTTPTVKYTRYLYDMTQCQCMVFKAILDKDHTQTLFWVCELFYSGFEYELLELAYILYMSYYVENHPSYGKFMKQQYTNSVNKELDVRACYYGNMFINMIYLTPAFYTMPPATNKRRIYLMLKYDDIEQFCSPPTKTNVLKTKCVYAIDLDHCAALCNADVEIDTPILTLHHQLNWLEYCIQTPYWINIFGKYNGCVKEGKVVFESEQDEDAFFEDYGYEPDEQPKHVHTNRGFIAH